MSERYARLFILPENLYAAGAPVVIAAGALLKDTQTDRVLAQLKLRNIGDKPIKAVTVKVVPLDTVGKPLGEAVDYQYLDLNEARDTNFGAKVPIVLPDAATRAFSASVDEVIFADNSLWTAAGAPWEPLSVPVPLETALEDSELAKQYRIEYGADSKYSYQTEKDLWRCVCGALNHQEEAQCHRCRKEAAALAALDIEGLKERCQERLADEAQKAAEAKAAAALKMKKAKKLAMIIVPIAIVIVAAGALISSHMEKSAAYDDAAALLEEGEYNDAIAAFEALGGFKDSADRVSQAKYDKAQTLVFYAKTGGRKGLSMILSDGEAVADDADLSKMYYEEAIAIFEELDGYQDSAEQAETIQNYLHAVELVNNGDYEAAADIFAALGDFGDSAEQLEGIEKLGMYWPYVGEFAYTLDGEQHHLSSDFVIEDGKVTWEVTIPDGELIGLGNYFFLSKGDTRQWPVSEDMTVVDKNTTMGTVTVKFENGNILVTGKGGYIDRSDYDEFWNRCYVKVN